MSYEAKGAFSKAGPIATVTAVNESVSPPKLFSIDGYGRDHHGEEREFKGAADEILAGEEAEG